MDRRRKRLILAALMNVGAPSLFKNDYKEYILQLISSMQCIPITPVNIQFRLFGEDLNTYQGRDVFTDLADNRYNFFLMTAETPESLIDLEARLSVHVGKEHKLTMRNRILMFVLWLRSYPTYHFLANMFNVSTSTVKAEIYQLLPVFKAKLDHYVQWPSVNEWRSMRGVWPKIPDAVGAIDGTSHEIYRPMSEPQQQYYSGHRKYHAVHTQIIVDASGIIRYIESGFMGHLNDAQQFRLMRQVGAELPLPEDCVVLGDKIYPNRGHIMTPYTGAQIARKQHRERRKCIKLNRFMRKYRVRVENTIGELKRYKVISSLWRHPRNVISDIVFICAALLCRHKILNIIL